MRNEVMRVGVWRVFCSTVLQPECAYSKPAQHVIVVHPDTWRVLSLDTKAQATFLTNMTQGAGGMKFLALDTGAMSELARADAAPVMAKDLLTQVAEESQALIVQASGLAAGASVLQMQVFMSRYAEVQRKLSEAELLLAKARSLVDLAGDAISSVGE
jgi:hypothetical protein